MTLVVYQTKRMLVSYSPSEQKLRVRDSQYQGEIVVKHNDSVSASRQYSILVFLQEEGEKSIFPKNSKLGDRIFLDQESKIEAEFIEFPMKQVNPKLKVTSGWSLDLVKYPLLFEENKLRLNQAIKLDNKPLKINKQDYLILKTYVYLKLNISYHSNGSTFVLANFSNISSKFDFKVRDHDLTELYSYMLSYYETARELAKMMNLDFDDKFGEPKTASLKDQVKDIRSSENTETPILLKGFKTKRRTDSTSLSLKPSFTQRFPLSRNRAKKYFLYFLLIIGGVLFLATAYSLRDGSLSESDIIFILATAVTLGGLSFIGICFYIIYNLYFREIWNIGPTNVELTMRTLLGKRKGYSFPLSSLKYIDLVTIFEQYSIEFVTTEARFRFISHSDYKTIKNYQTGLLKVLSDKLREGE